MKLKKESGRGMATSLVNLAYAKQVEKNSERIVLVHLSSLANQDRLCWVTVRMVSKNTRISKSGVKDALVSLCRQRLLRLREVKDGNTYVFRLNL